MKRYLAISILFASYEVSLILWLWLGHSPAWVQTHFYPLAWWPLVILTETLAQLFWSQSLLWEKPRSFFILSLASIPFWTIYEIINVGIENWIYIGLPESRVVRWLGYAIAYASVLPAIWAFLDIQNPKTSDNCLSLGSAPAPRAPGTSAVGSPPEGPPSTTGFRGIPQTRQLLDIGTALALVELALCLIWPKIFYPLAWGFLFFLTEPLVVSKSPEKSYLVAWSQKSFSLTIKTIVAGLLAGIVWEFLNWKATAKWVYTLPNDVALLKIFEMPLLGFFGFGAFALCAQSFSNALLAWWDSNRRYPKLALFVAGSIISLVGFSLIDSYRWIR